MTRTITEHELTFALNCLGVDNVMEIPDHAIAKRLIDIVDTNLGSYPTLVAGEQSSNTDFALGDKAAYAPNQVDDAVRLSHAAASVADALSKLDSHTFSKSHEALTDLVENLSRRAIAGLGKIDVAGPVQITTIGDVQLLTSGNVTLTGAASPSGEQCGTCEQADVGQTGEYPCKACGLPTTHDA